MTILCIYHDHCMDGFTAAWCLNRFFLDSNEQVEFYPASYSDKSLPDVTNKDVFILDFSYDRHILLDFKAKAKSLLVLDHHKTAQEKLKGLDFCMFDMNRSGASMAWDFFFPGERRHLLVDYVEDRDLWKFKFPHSREVNTVIMYTNRDFESWDNLDFQLEAHFGYTITKGEQMIKVEENTINQIIETSLRVASIPFLNINNIAVVNSGVLISDCLNKLCKDNKYSCAMAWSMSNDGSIKVSLRSLDHLEDVSVIAKALGGGGHRNASAFSIPNINKFLEIVSFSTP